MKFAPLSQEELDEFLLYLDSNPKYINIGRKGWGQLGGRLGNYSSLGKMGDFNAWVGDYERDVRNRLSGDRNFEIAFKEIFIRKISMFCPGCKHNSCKEGICHGSILVKIGNEYVR